jgi:Spy/CpxP family protein refolding chaperone
MRTTCRVLLVLGLTALLASPAMAQRGRGRGGFGGPGFFVGNKGVQKELKLTDEQVKKAEDALKTIREKHQQEFAGIQDLPQEERREKFQALNKTVSEEQTKALADVLSADQVKRLKQIMLQVRGAQAFADPEVQKELKLTDDQKDKIKTIGDDARQEGQSIREAAAGDFQEMQKKMAALNKETMEKVSGVLTDDQKKAWKDLTGDAFEFKPDPGQFGGRGKKKGGV